MLLTPVVTAKAVAGTLYAPVAVYYAFAGQSPEAGLQPVEKTRRQPTDNRERLSDEPEGGQRRAARPLPEPSAFVAQRISQERPVENPAGLRSDAVNAYGALSRQSRFVTGPVSGIDLIV
jgi:hypothetical protein